MYEYNPSAFPVHAKYDEETVLNEGMTLRDYFAAHAMQGMLAACVGWSEQEQKRLAKCSYMMADQMLIERESDE